ncbi:aspartate aminotransferase family protein [Alteribacillus sp. HJP-4]|uniref:aspartate aminotransferase family protein n=1 Tax=Alteribacillus sp. HJP-4 TaxID=2775394 RepID=UPI0035CCD97B
MAVHKLNHPILDFQKKTAASAAFMKEAESVMPGGVTANIKYFEPWPIVMKQGKGAQLTDLDNNTYIDYLMSYGALVTGHGHDRVREAVVKQMDKDGTWLFGTPHHLEVEMGKRLQKHFPSMELIRYTNSGTEATQLALRLAAAYTNKHKVAKFEGHYHGGYDQVLVSVSPSVHEAGREEEPASFPESKGMHPSHSRNTIILPFNDLNSCIKILKKHKDEIGAVIIEPVQAGFIPAEQEFMNGLRKCTEELNIVLIFDEVKTCYRICVGGAQSIYGVTPDLTVLGKAIGAGYPIGVTGGKKEIMMVSAPTGGSDVFDSSQSAHSSTKDVLFHSGTYNGHPMILAAGLEVLSIMEEEMNTVLERTNRLKKGIDQLFQDLGIDGRTIGIGSIFSVVLNAKGRLKNYRDLQKTDLATRKEIDFRLLQKGIYTKPMNRYSLSTAHTDEDISRTLNAFSEAIQETFIHSQPSS